MHGLWANGVTLPDHEQTFTQRLAQAGYSTYLAGRYQLSGVCRWTTEQARRGEFSQIDWAHGPLHRSRQNAYLEWLQQRYPEQHLRIFPVQANPDNTTLTQQQREALAALPGSMSFNRWVGQRIEGWIDTQSSEQPFLAIAGFSVGDRLGTEPHPATDIESVNRQALTQADEAIGQIMTHLQNTHRSHETVIIVSAARGSKESLSADNELQEKVIRVPLIFHAADFKPQTVDGLVSTMDIAPTVLSIANVPCGPRMQGESLLDLFEGAATARAPIAGAPISKPPSVRGWGLSRIRKSLPCGERHWQTAFYTHNMKLVVSHAKAHEDTIELFDLDADPQEQHDLSGSTAHESDLELLIDQMIDARCALEDRTEPRVAEF